jgi:hypothetical protein
MDVIDQYVDDLVGRAWKSAQAFRKYDQEQVDRIVDP